MTKNRGFTIVELLIVIIVVAILAAVTVVAFNGTQQRARDAQRKSDVAQIAKLLKVWSADRGPMRTGSGCGSSGNGDGWFNVQNGTTYPVSMMNCLINAGITNANIKDPSNVQSCSNGNTACRTYMKYTCTVSGSTRTSIFANLETPPDPAMDMATACSGTAVSTNYGMNYYVNIED